MLQGGSTLAAALNSPETAQPTRLPWGPMERGEAGGEAICGAALCCCLQQGFLGITSTELISTRWRQWKGRRKRDSSRLPQELGQERAGRATQVLLPTQPTCPSLGSGAGFAVPRGQGQPFPTGSTSTAGTTRPSPARSSARRGQAL